MNREHLIRRYKHNYFRGWAIGTQHLRSPLKNNGENLLAPTADCLHKQLYFTSNQTILAMR